MNTRTQSSPSRRVILKGGAVATAALMLPNPTAEAWWSDFVGSAGFQAWSDLLDDCFGLALGAALAMVAGAKVNTLPIQAQEALGVLGAGLAMNVALPKAAGMLGIDVAEALAALEEEDGGVNGGGTDTGSDNDTGTPGGGGGGGGGGTDTNDGGGGGGSGLTMPGGPTLSWQDAVAGLGMDPTAMPTECGAYFDTTQPFWDAYWAMLYAKADSASDPNDANLGALLLIARDAFVNAATTMQLAGEYLNECVELTLEDTALEAAWDSQDWAVVWPAAIADLQNLSAMSGATPDVIAHVDQTLTGFPTAVNGRAVHDMIHQTLTGLAGISWANMADALVDA